MPTFVDISDIPEIDKWSRYGGSGSQRSPGGPGGPGGVLGGSLLGGGYLSGQYGAFGANGFMPRRRLDFGFATGAPAVSGPYAPRDRMAQALGSYPLGPSGGARWGGGGGARQPATPAPAPGGAAPAPGSPVSGAGLTLEQILAYLAQGQQVQDPAANIIGRLLGGQTMPGTIFSPEGSAASREAIRQNAFNTADALNRRAALYANVAGLDPSMRGYAGLQSMLNTQGGAAQAINQAQNANALRFDDLLMNAFMNQLAAERGLANVEFQNIWNQRLQGNQGGGLADLLAQLGGGVAGSWLSPGGFFRGSGR
jgi:hypothetical protein